MPASPERLERAILLYHYMFTLQDCILRSVRSQEVHLELDLIFSSVQTCRQRPALHLPPCPQQRTLLQQSMIHTSQQCPAHNRLTLMRNRSTLVPGQSSMTMTGYSLNLQGFPDRSALPTVEQVFPMSSPEVVSK